MKKEKLLLLENGEALVLQQEIARLNKRITKLTDKYYQEISTKKQELRQICLHNETEKTEEYIEGDYYNKGKFIKRKLCKICGKELDKETIEGGYG